ncbi:hypothetical protein BURKHO8Y_340016 [Burkholderia sp. 8Y]|nr:hypothetical protein BURKHO8Y_340016 [Burkholderia sp. 8Y]
MFHRLIRWNGKMAYPMTLVFVSAILMLVFPETFGNGYSEK